MYVKDEALKSLAEKSCRRSESWREISGVSQSKLVRHWPSQKGKTSVKHPCHSVPTPEHPFCRSKDHALELRAKVKIDQLFKSLELSCDKTKVVRINLDTCKNKIQRFFEKIKQPEPLTQINCPEYSRKLLKMKRKKNVI